MDEAQCLLFVVTVFKEWIKLHEIQRQKVLVNTLNFVVCSEDLNRFILVSDIGAHQNETGSAFDSKLWILIR